jgi:serine/threonine-protein kinase
LEHAGYILAGRYRLEERVAFGAMGSIWRARHLDLKSPVAIKFLDVAVARETEMHGRFLQEARAAAAVRCAHVVQVFDYGRDANIPFIVMELLDGETLEQRLQRGVLTPRELDKIFREVACGIRHVHASGVVHRDLKPSNIFIAREGSQEVTKLIDFGIVKVDEARLGFTPRASTRAGTVIGTPEYMSPEQLRAGADVDQDADLWALAIVAFECLTGRLPFSGNSLPDVIVQICTEEAAAPSSFAQVPAGFDRWFAKATQKDVADRFASAEEMAAALSSILRAAPEASSQEQALSTSPPDRTAPLRHFPAVRAAWGAALARWVGRAPLPRPPRAVLSPVRAGWLGIALLGTALVLALLPARTEHRSVGPVQAPLMASPAAPAVAVPSAKDLAKDLSPTPEPTPASAPSAASVELRAATSRAPSERPAEPKELRKPRHPTGPRSAGAPLATVKGGGTGEPSKSALERSPTAAVLGRSDRGGQNGAAAGEVEDHPPSGDADSLFAERL